MPSPTGSPAASGRSNHGGQLWLISLNGNVPRKLDVDLSAAVDGQLGKIRLSPDGKKLAYVVGKSYQRETWVLEHSCRSAPALGGECRGQERMTMPAP